MIRGHQHHASILQRILLLTALAGSILQGQELAQLKLYCSGPRTEYVNAADEGFGATGHQRTSYKLIMADPAWVFRTPQSNTVPLNLYWSSARQDNILASEDGVSARKHVNTGYRFIRTEGFIYRLPQPNTIALRLYWSSENLDYVLAADGTEMERYLLNSRYTFIRTEGFALRQPSLRHRHPHAIEAEQ